MKVRLQAVAVALGVATTIYGVTHGGLVLYRARIQAEDAHAQADRDRDRRLDLLERVIYAEHPAYTLLLTEGHR